MLATDGKSVAVEHEGSLVQDGALTATPDCEESQVFVGFAGKWPESAWAIRATGRTPRLYRFLQKRWALQERFAETRALITSWHGAGALLVLAPLEAAGDKPYTIRALGTAARGPVPAAAAGPRCRSRLVEPRELRANARGDIAVLGRLCDAASAAFAVERWAPDARASEVVPLPTNVENPTIGLDSGGTLWLGATRATVGYVARYEGGEWKELSAPSRPVLSVSADSKDNVWLVIAPASGAQVTSAAAPVSCAPAEGVSNVWRYGSAGWQNVAMPPSAGTAVRVEARGPDDTWVVTTAALFRTRAPAEPLLWAYWNPCPLPITGAKPYTLRRAGPGPHPITYPDVLVGPDCPRFLLLDTTAKNEPSPTFDEVRRSLRESGFFGSAMREGEENYDYAFLAEGGRNQGSVGPFVTFELGRYFWGIWGDPAEYVDVRVAKYLRAKFPHTLHELCAAPYPIRVPALTKSSAVSPPR